MERFAARGVEGLMRYPLLVQTRIGNPDRLETPEGHHGSVAADPCAVHGRNTCDHRLDGLPN
eukprot:2271832-Prymnesium_polylepis.1